MASIFKINLTFVFDFGLQKIRVGKINFFSIFAALINRGRAPHNLITRLCQ